MSKGSPNSNPSQLAEKFHKGISSKIRTPKVPQSVWTAKKRKSKLRKRKALFTASWLKRKTGSII